MTPPRKCLDTEQNIHGWYIHVHATVSKRICWKQPYPAVIFGITVDHHVFESILVDFDCFTVGKQHSTGGVVLRALAVGGGMARIMNTLRSKIIYTKLIWTVIDTLYS